MESQSLAPSSDALEVAGLDADSHDVPLAAAPPQGRLGTLSLALSLLSALCFAAPFAIGLRYGAKPPSWFFLVFPFAPLAVPWLPALLGIICGHFSHRRQPTSAAATGDRWRGLMGLVIGYCMLGLNALAAGLALVLFLVLR
jgi:hypothetical protein